MTDPRWAVDRPAAGEILIRLMTLQARLLRIEAARRLDAASRALDLLKR